MRDGFTFPEGVGDVEDPPHVLQVLAESDAHTLSDQTFGEGLTFELTYDLEVLHYGAGVHHHHHVEVDVVGGVVDVEVEGVYLDKKEDKVESIRG